MTTNTDDKIAKAVERLSQRGNMFQNDMARFVAAQCANELAAVFVAAAEYRKAEADYRVVFDERSDGGKTFDALYQAGVNLDAALNHVAEKVLQ